MKSRFEAKSFDTSYNAGSRLRSLPTPIGLLFPKPSARALCAWNHAGQGHLESIRLKVALNSGVDFFAGGGCNFVREAI